MTAAGSGGLELYPCVWRKPNRLLKRYSIFPSDEVKISYYLKSPHPHQKFVAKHYMAMPPPLKGRGRLNCSCPQAT